MGYPPANISIHHYYDTQDDKKQGLFPGSGTDMGKTPEQEIPAWNISGY